MKPGANWNERIERWMRSRIQPGSSVTLRQRSIYILPSSSGLMFMIAVAVIFIAAINYAVSLAFGLAFLLVSVWILGILHTFNNLNRLSLKALPTSPVFCGEEIAFNIQLSRAPGRKHESIELNYQQGWRVPKQQTEYPVVQIDLVENDQEQVRVVAPAKRRGNFKAPYLRVSSTFPLGLARAWSVVDLDQHCLVYPRPIAFQMDEFIIIGIITLILGQTPQTELQIGMKQGLE